MVLFSPQRGALWVLTKLKKAEFYSEGIVEKELPYQGLSYS
jgi:hypothetical protein